jgi:hypothetical protein
MRTLLILTALVAFSQDARAQLLRRGRSVPAERTVIVVAPPGTTITIGAPAQPMPPTDPVPPPTIIQPAAPPTPSVRVRVPFVGVFVGGCSGGHCR